MKINDLEKLTGLKRSNIFYYEREGLLAPKREENNYREYSEDDLRRLKTVVVLRKLGFTVAELRSLLDGERALSDVLPENMARMEGSAAELGEALALCRELERRGVTMGDFDADLWFDTIENEEKQGRRFLDFVGDMADDVTRTMAFVQDSVGLQGPVWAMYFLSEEGIRKRRLWKMYWVCWVLYGFNILVLPMLLPGASMRPAHPVAAVAFLLVEGLVGSAVLTLCARYVLPRRKPRQALWIILAVTLAESVLLTAAGRPALEMTVDEGELQSYLASAGVSSGYLDDPLAYVQTEYNEKYYGGQAELQSWQAEDRMFVFASWGVTFEFRRQEDGQWQEIGVTAPTAGGTLYTADPYGPEPYPSRLMLADGTVVEPVYEARFDTVYIPLFAFDVSQGQTYEGLLYGVDESGGLHYALRTRYAIRPEKTMEAEYNEPDYFAQFSAAQVHRTGDGSLFISAYRDWRASVWRTEPTTALDTAYMGVSGEYQIYAEYMAPPGLTVDVGGLAPDEWELNEFSDVLYLRDDGLRYVWNMICDKDILPLLSADEVTPELLLAAARSAGEENSIGQPFDMESTASFTATRVWDGLPVPADLMALAAAVRAELG